MSPYTCYLCLRSIQTLLGMTVLGSMVALQMRVRSAPSRNAERHAFACRLCDGELPHLGSESAPNRSRQKDCQPMNPPTLPLSRAPG